MPRTLKTLFVLTDVGFIVYWLITALHIIPPAYLFKDYTDPLAMAWNWSFLPLDLFISATGLWSVWLANRNDATWTSFALISLVLTFCSGLMAIAFWTVRGDFDPAWWLPNLYLLIYPLFWLPRLRIVQPINAQTQS